MEPKTYNFNGKVYIQKPLVLGQMRQLSSLLQGTNLAGKKTVAELVELIGSELPKALAIVLTEEGKNIKDKDLNKIAEELEYSITLTDAVEVAEDFFGFNQVTSVSEKIQNLFGGMWNLEIPEETGSNTSASELQEETSQKETGSSGTAPQTS